MQSLVIVGAGGFGREVYTWANQCAECQRDWTIKGFLDDNRQALDSFDYPVPILAGIRDYQPAAGEVFLCGQAIPAVKQACATALKQRGAAFISLIHPTAIIGHQVELGEGVVICPRATLTCDIRIGNFVTLNIGASVGHDVRIGDWVTLCGDSNLSGHVQVGQGTFIAPHACALPKAVIGEQAFIGTGSIVLKNTPASTTVFGTPARPVPSLKKTKTSHTSL